MARKKQMNPRARRRVVVRFGPEEPRYLGYSWNVSHTGIMVGTTKVFTPGTILELELDLPGGGKVRTQGIVVWAREGPLQWLPTGRIGMGISFVTPNDDLSRSARVPPPR